MATETTNGRVLGAVLASLAAHAVLAAALPTEIAAHTRVREEIAEIDFQVLEIAPPPETAPPPPAEVAPPPPEPVAVAAVAPIPDRPPVAPTPAASSSSAASTSAPQETAPSERPAPDEAPITVPGGLRIDPRAVALGAMAAAGPRTPAPQAVDAPAVESAEARDARLTEQHSRFLATVGNSRDYVTRRGPPDLQRRPDGSYVYTGSAFSARIAPDGTVQFSDRANVRFGNFGGPDNSVGATIRFDITDAAERRHGNDPYQAERRWFLSETEELRERLGTEHRTATAVTEERGLRGSLERIWGDTTKPASRRRASLFRIWDDLAEDETGMPMRRAVLTFIRTRLPQGSPDAYPAEELAALNGRRQSDEAFAPY